VKKYKKLIKELNENLEIKENNIQTLKEYVDDLQAQLQGLQNQIQNQPHSSISQNDYSLLEKQVPLTSRF
jgi:chaperonin cofactor prefoldin